MHFLYVLGGIALAMFGLWQVKKEVGIFRKGKQDPLGNDIKLFGAGVMAIMVGVYLIVHYI